MSITGLLDRYLSNKRLIRPIEFLLKMALVYAGWRTFKYFGEHYDNFLWGGWQWFKDVIGRMLTFSSAMILKAAGYQLSYFERIIIVDGTRGIYVADLCLGIAPMVIFTGFIASFGDNARNKYWFIPLGLFLIFLTNVARVLALVLVQVHSNSLFGLAHDYVYVLLTYGLIFLLVLWWMNNLAFKDNVS